MNPKNQHRPSPGRLFAAFFLFLGWFAQIVPLSAFTAEANWKFETLQNTSSEWWQTLTIETVPGVVYHLQKSTTLEAGSWTTLSSTYGTGADWVCPIFPGTAPVVAAAGSGPTLPSPAGSVTRMAFLVLEKTTTGGTLISWSSLDDQSPRRQLLPGITLDPIWDEFDGSYMNSHGLYLFGISPRLEPPVTFTSSPATLGPLDTAMVAEFINSLPAITTNVQNSVASAANYNPQAETSTTERAFYRFSAEWSVDSDGDGRYDWQEILFDGNNPFAADSDGDGINDQAAGAPGTGSGTGSGVGSGIDPTTGLPLPTDAQPATPLAHIQQQSAWGFLTHYTYPLFPEADTVKAYLSDGLIVDGAPRSIDYPALLGASGYVGFRDVVNSLPMTNAAWSDDLSDFSAYYLKDTPVVAEDDSDGSYWDGFNASRTRFRLKLDKAAPAGGYHIPMRVGKIYQSIDPDTYERTIISPPSGQTSFVDITLECAENETEGSPVDVPRSENLAENQYVTYIPACLTTREGDILDTITGAVTPGPVIENGACVTEDESFVVDFGSSDGINLGAIAGIGYAGTAVKINWQKRKLMGDGSFGNWEPLGQPSETAAWHNGTHAYVRCNEPGVYQMQALLVLPDGSDVQFHFARLRNARSILDGKTPPRINALQQAGTPDFFGVTNDQVALSIRNKAVSWLGSKKYSKSSPITNDPQGVLNPNMEGKNKCNVFVAHVLNSVGATTPYWTHWGFSYAPIARKDWYLNLGVNVRLSDYGWEYGSSANSIQPGTVIASFGDDENGHVGILDYDGTWIGAGTKSVNKYLNIQNLEDHYKTFAIRIKQD